MESYLLKVLTSLRGVCYCQDTVRADLLTTNLMRDPEAWGPEGPGARELRADLEKESQRKYSHYYINSINYTAAPFLVLK